MTDFDQEGQQIFGQQQNAGRDIHTNLFPNTAWTPRKAEEMPKIKEKVHFG